jgi:hypothetical protein
MTNFRPSTGPFDLTQDRAIGIIILAGNATAL